MYFTVKLVIAANICALYIPHTTAGPDHLCSPDETGRMGVCGTNLADDLSLVCRGVYNKRGNSQIQDKQWLQYPNIVMRSDREQPTVDWDKTAKILDKVKRKNLAKVGKVSLEKRKAFSFISTIRRPGLVCECCVHNCSLDEMLMYCGIAQ